MGKCSGYSSVVDSIFSLIVFCKYIKMKQRLVNSTPQFSLWNHQRWSRGHKARGKGQKKSEDKDIDSEERPSRFQRTKDITRNSFRKKRSSLKKSQIFRKIWAISIKKKDFRSKIRKFSDVLLMTLANFQQVIKKCCPWAEDRAFSRTCRLPGQGLEHQIVSSRTPPLEITELRITWYT